MPQAGFPSTYGFQKNSQSTYKHPTGNGRRNNRRKNGNRKGPRPNSSNWNSPAHRRQDRDGDIEMLDTTPLESTPNWRYPTSQQDRDGDIGMQEAPPLGTDIDGDIELHDAPSLEIDDDGDLAIYDAPPFG